MIALALVVAGCGNYSKTANPTAPPTIATPPEENTKAVEQGINLKQLEIPKREHGYNNFDACLLTSHADLESFLAEVKTQQGWNDRGAFISGLRAAKIDFTTSALLLLRHTEGSGSVRVWLEPPMIRGNELVVEIGKEVPSMVTMDMAYYCYALVVPDNIAQRIRIMGSFVPPRMILTEDGQETLRPHHQGDIIIDL